MLKMARILSEFETEDAAAILREGGLVAFRTETVWGLAANLENGEKIFAAKARPAERPLVMQFPTIAAAKRFFKKDFTKTAEKLFQKFGGGITVVLPNGRAVRIPDDPIAKKILAAAKMPLFVTSANLSGRRPAETWQEIEADLGERIDAIVAGAPPNANTPSTIVEISPSPKILRDGIVPAQTVLDFISKFN
jgi:L-threonylcarbamoyladenylate synthase